MKKNGICYIASDTQCTVGNEQKELKDPKVLHFMDDKKFIIGVAGYLKAINSVRYYNGDVTDIDAEGNCKASKLSLENLTKRDIYMDIGPILFDLMNPPSEDKDGGSEDTVSCSVFAYGEDLYMTDSVGTVVETTENVLGVGSGSSYAVAVAKALIKRFPMMEVENVLRIALETACEIDIYSGGKFYMASTDSDSIVEL